MRANDSGPTNQGVAGADIQREDTVKRVLFWIMAVWLIIAVYVIAMWAIGIYIVIQITKGR